MDKSEEINQEESYDLHMSGLSFGIEFIRFLKWSWLSICVGNRRQTWLCFSCFFQEESAKIPANQESESLFYQINVVTARKL